MEPVTITVLVENSVYRKNLRAEHGLAFHIQTGAGSLLFDTGQSDLVVQNARELNVDLSQLRAVALSHGHYDHTGGLRAVWDVAPQAALFAHPAALGSHFAIDSEGRTRDVGISKRNRGAARSFAQRPQAVAATEVLPGIFLSGEIPRETNFEDVGGPFVSDETGAKPDSIADDQALFFDTPGGTVVLLGCAHSGVVNTLSRVQSLTGGRPLHTVLGGMHLVAASEERIKLTVAALRQLGIRCLAPAHCTGDEATLRLRQEFPGVCLSCATGSRFVFQR